MAATTDTDRTVATVNRFYREIYEEGNLDVVDELCAPNYVEHNPMPGVTPDRQGVKDCFRAIRAAFPDIRARVEDIIAANNKVAVRLRLTGTFRGEYMGMAPNGKTFDVGCIDIVHLDSNGQAIEHWGIPDESALAQPLGLTPQG